MAVKILKDKVINVRATEDDFLILDHLKKYFNCSKGEVVSKALNLLYVNREDIKNEIESLSCKGEFL